MEPLARRRARRRDRHQRGRLPPGARIDRPARGAHRRGVGVAAVALAAWETSTDLDAVGAVEWAHAAVSVTAYVAAAIGIALLGTKHDSWRLTALATGALVVFTTFQSFAVFAPIIEGAWLFVVLGLIFLGTGFTFDRARRRLAAALEGEAR